MTSRRFPLARRALLLLAVLAVIVAVAQIPVTTRQGVNYVVSSQTVPLYVKALDFVQRHVHYRRLADQIVAGQETDEARALALFEWAGKHIVRRPPGLPVVDDHVWHVVIRGYGDDDQKVDVFTTLAAYADLPAYWIYIGTSPPKLPMAFVQIDGRWRAMDVVNGVLFRNRRGELASAEELAADRSLVAAAGATRTYGGQPYASFFHDYQAPKPPKHLRPERQMPWRRLVIEAKRLAGL